jgi:hypothetical protein
MGILNAGTAMAEPVFLVVAGPLALDLVGQALGLEAGARATMFVAVAFLGLAALALLRVDAHRRELGAEPSPREPVPISASADT